jgi:hypothetical protein
MLLKSILPAQKNDQPKQVSDYTSIFCPHRLWIKISRLNNNTAVKQGADATKQKTQAEPSLDTSIMFAQKVT